MARQSPTNPRFRCNVCKDYYSAPKYKVHYQCASHGYLCEEHIYKTIYILYQMKNDFEEEFYIIVEREEINSVLEEIKRWNDRSDWCFIIDSLTEVTDKITISNLLNKCLCWKDPKKNLGKDYLPSEHLMFEGGVSHSCCREWSNLHNIYIPLFKYSNKIQLARRCRSLD